MAVFGISVYPEHSTREKDLSISSWQESTGFAVFLPVC